MRLRPDASFLVLFAILAAPVAHAEDDCAAKRAELAAAKEALRDCRRSGKSCDDVLARRDAAEAAAASCPPAPPESAPARAPSATEAAPAPARTGKLALLVEAPKADPLDAAAREALAGATVLDAGSVRAARSFLGLTGDLDDAGAEKLRASVGADRLIIVQVKADGVKRFVAVKTVDQGVSGIAARRFSETSEAEVPAAVKQLVGALPAIAAPPSTAPVAVAAPTAAPTAAPAPTPTPKPWAPMQAPQYRHAESDEKEYGKKGVRVFSGDMAFANQTTVNKPDGGEDFTTRSTELSLRPGIATFAADGLLLGVTPILTTSSSTDDDDERETDTSVGVLFQGAYLARSSGDSAFFFGPQFGFGYLSRKYKISQGGASADFTQTGPIFSAALAVRAPVGKGGVIGFSVYAEHFPTTLAGDLDGTYTFTTFGVSNSLAVWF